MAAAQSTSQGVRHQPWLDAVRALAALAVLLSHVRQFTLRDAAAQGALSLPARAFFGLSGLGHQAVIVFFVLSGFLVASSMRRLAADGQWSLVRFGLERLSRLWPVLIPCLLLGGILDRVGLDLTAAPVESYGRLALTTPLAPPARDAATLLGNVLFLQTIAVPVYGSNGPLWSLAAEAWFYALAALGFSAWHLRASSGWAPPLTVLLLLAAWLPTSVLALFPVWLCGAAACLVGVEARSGARSHLRFWIAAFVAVLLAARFQVGPAPLVADWTLGLATAGLLRGVASLPCPDGAVLRPLGRVSAMSYSLYLSHVPILALLSTLLVGPQRLGFGLSSTAIILLDIAITLACAAGVWWCFERHTPALRRLLLRRFAALSRPALATLATRSTLT